MDDQGKPRFAELPIRWFAALVRKADALRERVSAPQPSNADDLGDTLAAPVVRCRCGTPIAHNDTLDAHRARMATFGPDAVAKCTGA